MGHVFISLCSPYWVRAVVPFQPQLALLAASQKPDLARLSGSHGIRTHTGFIQNTLAMCRSQPYLPNFQVLLQPDGLPGLLQHQPATLDLLADGQSNSE